MSISWRTPHSADTNHQLHEQIELEQGQILHETQGLEIGDNHAEISAGQKMILVT